MFCSFHHSLKRMLYVSGHEILKLSAALNLQDSGDWKKSRWAVENSAGAGLSFVLQDKGEKAGWVSWYNALLSPPDENCKKDFQQ